MLRRQGRRTERGAVTAELAMALPVLLAVTVLLTWVLSWGYAQVRMVDATREAARALARGDDESAALATAGTVAPPGARFRVVWSGDQVSVEGSVRMAPPAVGLRALPRVRLTASAVALVESGRAP